MTLAPDKNFLNTPASLKSYPAEWHVLWPGTVHFFCVFYYILAVHFFSTQQVNLPHFLFAFISPYYRIKSVHRCWKFWHLYAVTVPCCWTGFRYAYLSIAFMEAGMPGLQKRYWNKLSESALEVDRHFKNRHFCQDLECLVSKSQTEWKIICFQIFLTQGSSQKNISLE